MASSVEKSGGGRPPSSSGSAKTKEEADGCWGEGTAGEERWVGSMGLAIPRTAPPLCTACSEGEERCVGSIGLAMPRAAPPPHCPPADGEAEAEEEEAVEEGRDGNGCPPKGCCNCWPPICELNGCCCCPSKACCPPKACGPPKACCSCCCCPKDCCCWWWCGWCGCAVDRLGADEEPAGGAMESLLRRACMSAATCASGEEALMEECAGEAAAEAK